MKNLKVFTRQPAYLPGLVFFDQLLQVDKYIIYDNVQYERRHWGNRNKIRTYQGEQWLTVPVIQKNKRSQTYAETLIDNNTHWAKDHWKAIYLNYAKAPFFKDYAPFFEDLYSQPFAHLLDLDLKIIEFIKQQLDIKTPLILASSLKTKKNDENKTDRLAQMVKELGGNMYITSKGTKNYIDAKCMESYGIELLWHEFSHPIYQQFHGEFIPYMSAIDLLFNYGGRSIDIIRENTKDPLKFDQY